MPLLRTATVSKPVVGRSQSFNTNQLLATHCSSRNISLLDSQERATNDRGGATHSDAVRGVFLTESEKRALSRTI